MERYVYYQPNKKDIKDRQGDCAVRALTRFFGLSWLEAFDELVVYARETQEMVNSLTNIKRLLSDKNIGYHAHYAERQTVEEFAKERKTGFYLLYIKAGFRTHMVTVVDGKYYDTWDCGKKLVYGYWRNPSPGEYTFVSSKNRGC